MTSPDQTVATHRGGKLPTVQVLRGVAASLVVFHHFARIYQGGASSPSWIYRSGLGNLGACGVDIFFVISGFIMVYTTRRTSGLKDALAFLRKRALRIYPLYWVWTTVLVVLWLTGMAKLSGGASAFHYSFAYIIQSYFLIPVNNGDYFRPLLFQGWTLSFEMLFYFLFACGVSLHLRRGKLPFLVAAFAFLVLVPRFINVGGGLAYLFSNPIIIEFLFGVLAAQLLDRVSTLLTHRSAANLATCLMTTGTVALISTIAIHTADSQRYFFWGLPSLLIVFGALLRGADRAPAPLVFLGDASYSIYLTHGFLTLAYASALRRFPALHTVQPDAAILVLGSATIVLTAFTYPVIERPLTEFIARKPSLPADQRSPSSRSDPSRLNDTVESIAN
jgi:exopolysaccharide production protein ExoZ